MTMRFRTGGGWFLARRAAARVAMAAALVAGALVAVAPPANAGPALYGYGYVWANDSDSTLWIPYVPSLGYQANSSGAVNTVVRLNTGRYVVTLPNLGPFGTAMVTAYGGATARPDDRCKIHDWFSFAGDNPRVELDVRCFSRYGGAVDAQFTAAYTNPAPGSVQRGAYVRNDVPSAPLGSWYTPIREYQYNSLGGTNTIVRQGVGDYRVRLAGLGIPYGDGYQRQVHVTAFGSPSPDPAVRCGYGRDYRTDPYADFQVRCHNSAGVATDSRFILTHVEGSHLFVPLSSQHVGVAKVYCSPGTACTAVGYGFSTSGGPVTVQNVGTGEFDVRVPLPLAGGTVQVTGGPQSALPGHCKVAFWNYLTGIRIRCYDHRGNRADATLVWLGFARPV
ncbi:hypothetical protein [Micromonospora echinofusca]|uniref:hypothetical protein n=1 Tax=Micromonospora echinofusca TaxID=47858 RepID=UPI0033DB280F